MCQQHPAGFNFDGSDIIFSSYRLDFALLRIVRDQCTRSFRIHGVEQTYRDIGVLGRLNTSGMQDFCAEVCQLRRFLKMKMTYGSRLVYNTRIIVVHTINVSPNLNFGSIDSRTDQRSGIVAATTLQIIYLTVCITADVTLRDVDIGIGMQLKLNLKFLLDIYRIGFGILISTHVLQSRKQD